MGHPVGEGDVFLVPQIADIIKPHQVREEEGKGKKREGGRRRKKRRREKGRREKREGGRRRKKRGREKGRREGKREGGRRGRRGRGKGGRKGKWGSYFKKWEKEGRGSYCLIIIAESYLFVYSGWWH